ncbi:MULTISPECIES: hypothetical protein [Sphingobacterium]|uniref:hypothetical protein n=1 Tax=Sphingobacterium TaxID=28453 RepID=UPI000DD9F93A|nr:MULTISPECIES: hypothetical protein [Sphingobacterium]QRQ61968.1 hypothetical protein I6J33_02970 [Sphingobacterium multivorum]
MFRLSTDRQCRQLYGAGKVDWWNRGRAQNRGNAVGIKGGLPELKEAYWNGKRPIEIAKGLFSKLN